MKKEIYQIRIGASVIPLFNVFLTEESISGTISIIKGHRQGQNVKVMAK